MRFLIHVRDTMVRVSADNISGVEAAAGQWSSELSLKLNTGNGLSTVSQIDSAKTA